VSSHWCSTMPRKEADDFCGKTHNPSECLIQEVSKTLIHLPTAIDRLQSSSNDDAKICTVAAHGNMAIRRKEK
jgi:hypothetical protein